MEGGASVLIIEHNLDIIKSADWVVDLGPEGGDAGGRVIAAGTPEQIARNSGSFTGQFLARVLAEGAAQSAAGGGADAGGTTVRNAAESRFKSEHDDPVVTH